jgi:hypothetical protein
MYTKLTLRLEKQVIERIKTVALRRRQSLSALTTELYQATLNAEAEQTGGDFKGIAGKYKSIVSATEIGDYREAYLREKHQR